MRVYLCSTSQSNESPNFQSFEYHSWPMAEYSKKRENWYVWLSKKEKSWLRTWPSFPRYSRRTSLPCPSGKRRERERESRNAPPPPSPSSSLPTFQIPKISHVSSSGTMSNPFSFLKSPPTPESFFLLFDSIIFHDFGFFSSFIFLGHYHFVLEILGFFYLVVGSMNLRGISIVSSDVLLCILVIRKLGVFSPPFLPFVFEMIEGFGAPFWLFVMGLNWMNWGKYGFD